MPSPSTTTEDLRDALIAAGLLVPTSVVCVYARGGEFERVRLALDAAITRAAAPPAAGERRTPAQRVTPRP